MDRPVSLQLRHNIYCPECLSLYTLTGNLSYSEVLTLKHINNRCSRVQIGLDPFRGKEITYKKTQYIKGKDIGKGIALIQIDPNITLRCSECEHTYHHYKLEDITVVFFHPDSYSCKVTSRLPLTNFTIFV